MTPEESLEERFHWIPWREPLTVSSAEVPFAYACRFCIALTGLNTEDIDTLPQTRDAFLVHLGEVHGLRNGRSGAPG